MGSTRSHTPRLYSQATLALQSQISQLTNGSSTTEKILNFVAASRAQRRALQHVYVWRYKSLRVGSYEVSSQTNGVPIFGAYAGIKCDTGTTWLLKVTETSGPTAKDLVICVPEVDVPLLRGLQMQCTRQDKPNVTLWAQAGKLIGTQWTRAIAAMRLGGGDMSRQRVYKRHRQQGEQ